MEQPFDITQGFNDGYFLQQHNPDFIEVIVENLSPTDEYLEGLFAGSQEYKKEQEWDRLNELRNLDDVNPDQNNDQDR